MAGSNWQQYYDPQIAARNRWAERSYAGPDDLPPRAGRLGGTARQGWAAGLRVLVAAGAAAGAALVALLTVLGVHLSRPEPLSVVAPAAPVTNTVPAPASLGLPGLAVAE